MAGVKGVVEVDAGQDGEDVGLQHGDQQLERGQRDGERERQRRRGCRQAPVAAAMATKPAKILSAMWPASMLAKRRTDRLIGRETNEMTSIATTSGRC